MKKVLLLIAAVAASFSAIAEDFSMAKAKTLKGAAYRDYVANSNVSKQFTIKIGAQKIYHTNKNWTIQETNKLAEDIAKANPNLNVNELKDIYSSLIGVDVKPQYASYYIKYLMARKNYEKVIEVSQKYSLYDNNVLQSIKTLKKYDVLWEIGEKALTKQGGYAFSEAATKLIQTMFRYKPATVTKQDQIKFIEQLAQIYPIPGTDFNKWKGFMGFIGYKYKALTGKDLFPESK